MEGSENNAASFQPAVVVSSSCLSPANHEQTNSLEVFQAFPNNDNGLGLQHAATPRANRTPATENHLSGEVFQTQVNLSYDSSRLQTDSEQMLESVQRFLIEKDQTVMQTSEDLHQAQVEKAKLQATIADLNKKILEKNKVIADLTKKYQNSTDRGSLTQLESSLTSSLSLSESSNRFSPIPTSNLMKSEIHQPTESEHFQQITVLKERIKSMQLEIKKMQDMNLQWQRYDQQRENYFKVMHEDNARLKRESEGLKKANKALVATQAGSSQSLDFSQSQQNYMENIFQELRSEADQYKEQLHATAEEAERNLQKEQKLRLDAEKNAQDLTLRLSEQEEVSKEIESQCEELRAALVVATRSHQYSAPQHRVSEDQQNTINSLREVARQYESDYRNLEKEFEAAKRELSSLQRLLNERAQPSSLQQRFDRHAHSVPPSSRDSANREQSSRWFDNIETDSHVEQLQSLPVQAPQSELSYVTRPHQATSM